MSSVLSHVKLYGILLYKIPERNGINIKKEYKILEINTKTQEIAKLRESKNLVILSHYYTNPEIQSLADYVGDSFYLCQKAAKANEQIILICGVRFMGESLKLLCPTKKVLLPEPQARCPMAQMTTAEEIRKARETYDDLAVVCYINSTLEVKSLSDVCVTSANAERVVSQLREKNIYFVPDQNLGRYVASKLPEKQFHFCQGYCYVHTEMNIERVSALKKKHPKALVLAHPECSPAVLDMADYVGSSSGILHHATILEDDEFILCTEVGLLHELEKINANKKFYFVDPEPICQDMKKITLESVYEAIKQEKEEVILDPEMVESASNALNRMMELADK